VKELSPESFALSKLSTGIHGLKLQEDWMTFFMSENSSSILGVPTQQLLDSPKLWIRRIHPADVDAVRGALQSTTDINEKHISYRFRDANERYRWIGLRCSRQDSDSIVGVFQDITRQRFLEYADRIHFAGRNSLRALLDTNDLNFSINSFLSFLGNAMLVDSARLTRFRKDGNTFTTHEWLRSESEQKVDLPISVQPDVANWWKEQFASVGVVSIPDTSEATIPNSVREQISKQETKAIMAAPAIINGVYEGYVSFETYKDRIWLPLEIEEATHIIDGYARSVERRIEDRKQIAEEFNIRRSEERYRLLTSHSPVILFGIDADGIFTLSEGVGLESMGAGAGEVVGASVYQVYRNYPDILEQVNTALSGVESHGLTNIGDNYFEVWFTPVQDEEQVVIGISGVAVDITRRYKLEQQQTIMMSELDHRVKNNIAAVMSLVGLSKGGADSIDEFTKTLDGRLHALSVAHSTLAKSHWSGASMGDILRLTLDPYITGGIERLQFKGPDVELPGLLARPMCMVIHELATNAVKYGALSTPEGSLTISTELPAKSNLVKITWLETGGPKIETKIKSGTGTSLLKGLVDHEMQGTITLNYLLEGLLCQIEVPLDITS
jgi:PAS domain S-box-containing protein